MNTICPDCNADIRLKDQPHLGQIITCNDCHSITRLISTEPAILESLDAGGGDGQPASIPSQRPVHKSKKRQGQGRVLVDFELDDGHKPRREDQDRSKIKRNKPKHYEDFPIA